MVCATWISTKDSQTAEMHFGESWTYQGLHNNIDKRRKVSGLCVELLVRKPHASSQDSSQHIPDQERITKKSFTSKRKKLIFLFFCAKRRSTRLTLGQCCLACLRLKAQWSVSGRGQRSHDMTCQSRPHPPFPLCLCTAEFWSPVVT